MTNWIIYKLLFVVMAADLVDQLPIIQQKINAIEMQMSNLSTIVQTMQQQYSEQQIMQ